ncbi:MAG: SGNH/GDSL hydrolase family protein [Cyanobacteria bacterium SBLK]|nr:SGNH/GDSL hydrolase family protein [Cyanobacteria bacterium SBLK]
MTLNTKAFFTRIYAKIKLEWKRLLYQEILVLGDSHVSVFRHEHFRTSFPKYYFHVIGIIGATVSGFKNPNSKTKALSIYKNYIKRTTAKIMIVLLGEVDVGFVIWYRAAKYKTSVAEMLEEALTNYQKFLLTTSEKFKIICISAPLATIKDGQDFGEVANARKSVTATQQQRTELTLQFNQRMQDFCQQHEIVYLSLDRESLGSDGLVDSKLLNSKLTNHHYNRKVYAEMIAKHLKTII